MRRDSHARQDLILEAARAVLKRISICRGPTMTIGKTQRPISGDGEHVVLKFRPRTSAYPPGRHEEPAPPHALSAANDLSRYERLREEPDDFRHRMLANI